MYNDLGGWGNTSHQNGTGEAKLPLNARGRDVTIHSEGPAARKKA